MIEQQPTKKLFPAMKKVRVQIHDSSRRVAASVPAKIPSVDKKTPEILPTPPPPPPPPSTLPPVSESSQEVEVLGEAPKVPQPGMTVAEARKAFFEKNYL